MCDFCHFDSYIYWGVYALRDQRVGASPVIRGKAGSAVHLQSLPGSFLRFINHVPLLLQPVSAVLPVVVVRLW